MLNWLGYSIKPHLHLRIFLCKALLDARVYWQIVFYVKFCPNLRMFVRKGLCEIVTQKKKKKKNSRNKIVFKMPSINKYRLLAVALVILRRRRRCKNKETNKNEKERIWVKIMNENRLSLVLSQLPSCRQGSLTVHLSLSKQIGIYPSDCLSSVFA